MSHSGPTLAQAFPHSAGVGPERARGDYDSVKTTLYEKIGRRYHPVNDPYAYDGLPIGSWIVVVSPGCTSIRRAIEPDYAGFEAAAHIALEGMVEAIRKAGTMRPCRKLTKKEQNGLEAYEAIAGKSTPLWMESASPADIADAAIEAVRKAYKAQKAQEDSP